MANEFSSDAQSCPTLWDPMDSAHQASLSITNSQSLLKLMSIESVMPPNHLILCCPLLLLFSIFPSIRIFSKESVLHIRWPKYWSFNFSISTSNEYLGWTGLFSLLSKGLSRVFSNTTVQKHQRFSTQLSLWSKFQYLATWCEDLTHCKRPWCWERLKAGGEGSTEDEMVGWHHQLNGHEFVQTPGDGEGQRSLVRCSPWGLKELETTQQLNNNNIWYVIYMQNI